jgi:hypothetical protein
MVWRAPVNKASHGLWKNGGKGINFIFCLGTAYDLCSMEEIGNSHSFSLTGKACLPKCFYLYNLRFELWHIWQISASLCEGPIYLLLCNFYFSWVSIFSYKAKTREHYSHTCALDVANIWVCFMNGSMIEHNGLGITFFSVDILKDMVAC